MKTSENLFTRARHGEFDDVLRTGRFIAIERFTAPDTCNPRAKTLFCRPRATDEGVRIVQFAAIDRRGV